MVALEKSLLISDNLFSFILVSKHGRTLEENEYMLDAVKEKQSSDKKEDDHTTPPSGGGCDGQDTKQEHSPEKKEP